MRRVGKWLPTEEHCCLPSPRLYPIRVAGLVFNFSRTVMPEESPLPTWESHRHTRRHRPASVGVREFSGERASAS
jgi:hypothetical protein